MASNIRASLLEFTPLVPAQNRDPAEYLQAMSTDGSWPDEDYKDTNREHWKAIDHLPRLEKILAAYYSQGSTLYHRTGVLNRCVLSLRFWLQQDPQNANWWHNVIGVPSYVGQILILLGNDAPADLQQAGCELMKRAKLAHQTGANLTDVAKIQVMRGCVSGSIDLISEAYDRTWQEVKLAGAGEDGIQADHSFHQHGPLLYCRGYGTVFVDDIVQFVTFGRGTSFAMPADKQQLFDAYLLGGPDWMLRGGDWDFGACGRSIVRDNTLRGSMLKEVQTMAGLPGPMQSELQAVATRLVVKDDTSAPIGNRHYWLSDYMVQRRANYFASVRMYSTRTLNTDGLTNGENKKTHHIADGATCLMTGGGEYFNIFPIWDWMKIPGTTAEQTAPLDPEHVSHKGKSPFAGEVSDGMYGCSAMELEDAGVHADKAWFCFDREMICLGTDIRCKGAGPVVTTINQCLLRGPVTVFGESPTKSPIDRDLKNGRWVWHDSIGYIFPGPPSDGLHLKTTAQTGSWAEIGIGSNKPVSGDVFSLWIDHGPRPDGAQYQYIIQPGCSPLNTRAESQNPPVKVLANASAQQAVFQTDLNILQAVFREPGEVNAGKLKVAVDKACLLLLKRDGEKMELAVSNPLNEPLTVNASVSLGEHHETVSIDLPTGLMAGSSVVREITISN